jgi:hypothetical protein
MSALLRYQCKAMKNTADNDAIIGREVGNLLITHSRFSLRDSSLKDLKIFFI